MFSYKKLNFNNLIIDKFDIKYAIISSVLLTNPYKTSKSKLSSKKHHPQ